MTISRSTTHGMSKTLIYKVWGQMIQRCENPKVLGYKNWGGRGISVCERWHKFENFYADVGDPPKGLTLDRINNDGNYEPTNWRWATRKEQTNNSRTLYWFRAWHKDMMCQFMSKNQSEFARMWRLSFPCVSLCLSGKQKAHKGWQFQKIESGFSF